MVIAACEQHEPQERRLVSDELAIRFLPPVARVFVRLRRSSAVRGLLIRATDGQMPGLWAGMLCRKRYGDDEVRHAVDAGIRQVVILGAGLDTRAYRLLAPVGATAYEVDQPAAVVYKRRLLNRLYGRVPDLVTLVAVNFETDDLAAALVGAGWHPGERTMFVWEGVSQYLSSDAAATTFLFLARAALGSRLIFTYGWRDFLDGTDLYGSPRAYERFVR